MLDYTLPLVRTGDGSLCMFEISRSIHNDWWSYINEIGEKTNDHFRIRVDHPFRPRTTGPRSQSARFRGHCEDLSEQIVNERGERIYMPKQIAEAMKRMSVEHGYPTHMTLDGVEEADSEASLSIEQEAILLRTQQTYADSHDLWLTEYSEDKCMTCAGTGFARTDLGVAIECGDCKAKGTITTTYRSVHGRTKAEMDHWWKDHPRGTA